MGKNDKMGKKSKLAMAAKKCHCIKSFFATKISTTSDKAGHPTPNHNRAKAKDPPEVFVGDDDLKPPAVLPTAPRSANTIVVYCKSVLESEDDGNEARKKTATRSVSTASTAFAAANATTTEESSEDDDDDDLINYTLQIPSTATSFKRNRSMLKDPTEVFEAVVNNDDKKPPLPLEWTRLGKSPTDSFDVVEIKEVKCGMRICNCCCQEIADLTTSVQFHDEHGVNQAWLSEDFDTRNDYSIKLVPIRISSNLKHVEMYREAAREMWSCPE